MNQKIENWVLGGLSVLFLVYVALRAWLLPITVDESSTVFNHVPRLVFDTLTFEKEANPNNHILNTLLIKLFTGIFGWRHEIVRLPVFIGACLYAWASSQLVCKLSDNSWVRIFALLMLFGNPFLLEFFSLARGYGLAAGLMTVALWQGWRFLTSNDGKALRLAFLFASLAVYANFTLLVFFAPFVSILLLASWQLNAGFRDFWRISRPALITVGVFVLLWITPLKRLSKDSELLNWTALGSFYNSMKGSIRSAINSNAHTGELADNVLTPAVFLGAIIIILIGLWRWWKNGFQFSRDPRVYLVLVLLGVCVTNIVQVYLTRTPYLQARLALFYWPLFALALGSAAGWVREYHGQKKMWILMAPLLALFFINTVRTANLHTTYEWYHDSSTFVVLDYLKELHTKEGRTEPFTIDTEWFMQNSIMFHMEKGHYGYEKAVKLVPYHNRRPPTRETDFFYAVDYDYVKEILDSYDIVLRIPNSSLILLRKK
jgi:hypothetical protein